MKKNKEDRSMLSEQVARFISHLCQVESMKIINSMPKQKEELALHGSHTIKRSESGYRYARRLPDSGPHSSFREEAMVLNG